MWAEGLISAARTVAGVVQHLCKAANSASLGNASEEELIVAAQAVSAATATLVAASTVKSNPNNPSQIKLKEASSKVNQATQMLVDAAKRARRFEEEQNEDEEDPFQLNESMVSKMEKQMEILRLEKELEKARNQLGNMRKQEYTKDQNSSSSSTPSSSKSGSTRSNVSNSSGVAPSKSTSNPIPISIPTTSNLPPPISSSSPPTSNSPISLPNSGNSGTRRKLPEPSAVNWQNSDAKRSSTNLNQQSNSPQNTIVSQSPSTNKKGPPPKPPTPTNE